MKQQTPVTAGTATGVSICTAEAAQVLNPSIRLLAVELNNRSFHSDVPQLPNRM